LTENCVVTYVVTQNVVTYHIMSRKKILKISFLSNSLYKTYFRKSFFFTCDNFDDFL